MLQERGPPAPCLPGCAPRFIWRRGPGVCKAANFQPRTCTGMYSYGRTNTAKQKALILRLLCRYLETVAWYTLPLSYSTEAY